MNKIYTIDPEKFKKFVDEQENLYMEFRKKIAEAEKELGINPLSIIGMLVSEAGGRINSVTDTAEAFHLLSSSVQIFEMVHEDLSKRLEREERAKREAIDKSKLN